MDGDDIDARLAAIARDARAARPRTSRPVWILASIVGLVSVIAFVIVLLADADPAPATVPAPARDGRGGFVTGLAIGIGVGIAIGYAIAGQARRASPAPHSSRNSP